MKKLLSILLGFAAAAAFGQQNPVSIQKYPQTNVVTNGAILIGSGNRIEVLSGGSLTLDSGSSFNLNASLPWSSLTSIPSPTASFTGDATGAITLLASGGATASLTLAPSGVSAGSYGSSSVSPTFAINSKGLVTGVTNNTITPAAIGALAVGNSLSDVASASVARSNLGLTIGAQVEAWSSALDTFAANGSAFYVPATRTVNSHPLTANVTVTPTDLGLVIGTNVQAFNSNLTLWAAITPYAGSLAITSGKTLTSTNSLTLSGSDGSTINFGTGGTLGTNAYSSTAFVPTTTTVNSHALSSNVTVSASDVGLGSVTNAAQTLASVVPNTAPSSGQILVGNSGGTAYAPVSISGDAALTNAGALTVSSIGGKAVTLAGSLTTTGANSLSIATTGSTSVTLPTSGTLLAANQTITLSGDATGSGATSIAVTNTKLNGVSLAGLATGLLKNTTTTGVPSIAVAGTDYSTPSATETLTNKTIAGGSNTISGIANASLTNSAITIAGSSTSLGGSITLDSILGLSTGSTGLLKQTAANTLGFAVAGTDYSAATSGSYLLAGNGAGGYTNVTSLTGLSYSSGALTVTASTIPTAATSMANLRTISTTGFVQGTVVTLAGYYNPGDGGGGDFVWESSDTTADNGGTVIKVTATSTGRLHRIQPSSNYGSQLPNTTLDIRWFGAIPDVSTDCTPGILAAYNSAVFGGSNESPALYAPAGQYLLLTKLNLSAGSSTAFTLFGDGMNATIFVYYFQSSDTAMWDIGNFPYVSIRNVGFTNLGGVAISKYLYFHTIAELDLEGIRAGGLSGTFIDVQTVTAWSRIVGINTANATGTQILINGSGGVLADFNLGTGFGTPCLMVESCDALNIHDGQCSGGGPYVAYTGAAVTSTGTTFTITQAAHGFLPGDYIYLSAAGTHAGYVNRWRIASTTTNTITIASTANLGSDTVTFGAIWCVGYFGGAQATGLDSESTCYGVIWNTAISAPTSSTSLFVDGCSGGSVHMKFGKMLCDYGLTSVFAHGFATSAFDGSNSYLYTIATSNANQFTLTTCSSSVNAGSFVNGTSYCIQSVGSTSFTAIGASANTVGVIFTATGAGSGSGSACPTATHTLKPGGYAHVTGSAYQGYWKIQSVTANTVVINSGINPGTTITVPLEGDVLTSSVAGCQFNDITSYVGDDFGGFRIEGASDIEVNNCDFENPGNGLDPTSVHNSIVVSDGGQTSPIVDVAIDGGQITSIGQSALVPAWTKNGIIVDGPLVLGVRVRSLLTGSVSAAYTFVNSATPNTCNLDTDYFQNVACIAQIGSSGQSFTTGVQASVSWASVAWDPLGMWTAANPTNIYVPTGAQVVELVGQTHWSSNPTPLYVTLQHFGSGNNQIGSVAAASQPYNAQMTVSSGPVNVQPGDYFSLQCLQGSGSSQTLAYSPETSLKLVILK
jgi:hypothetical protein